MQKFYTDARSRRFVQAMIDGWPPLRAHLALEEDAENGAPIVVLRNEESTGSGAYFILQSVKSIVDNRTTINLNRGRCLDPNVRAVFLFALAQWFGDDR